MSGYIGYIGYKETLETNFNAQPVCAVLEITDSNTKLFDSGFENLPLGHFVVLGEDQSEINAVASFKDLESAFNFCKTKYSAISFRN